MPQKLQIKCSQKLQTTLGFPTVQNLRSVSSTQAVELPALNQYLTVCIALYGAGVHVRLQETASAAALPTGLSCQDL